MVRWLDRVTYVVVRDRTQQPVTPIILQRRWRWLGHILRMAQDSWYQRALFHFPERPSHTIHRSMELELLNLGLSWDKIRIITLQRRVRRTFVTSLMLP
jgi:hypothetical protein